MHVLKDLFVISYFIFIFTTLSTIWLRSCPHRSRRTPAWEGKWSKCTRSCSILRVAHLGRRGSRQPTTWWPSPRRMRVMRVAGILGAGNACYRDGDVTLKKNLTRFKNKIKTNGSLKKLWNIFFKIVVLNWFYVISITNISYITNV